MSRMEAMCDFGPKSNFRRAKFRAHRVATVATALGLCACSTVGPASIDQGRIRYNEVIQDTSKQQALLNIVRVANGESPLFVDVSEVDAAASIGGTISGGPSGLGASPGFKSTSAGTIAGAVGFVTGSAQYQEAPTVRYFPLSGQALVAQVSTPLSAQSLVDLFNSDWPPASVLTLGVDRLTGDFLDYFAALNAIIDLDQYGAIILAATPKSEKEKTSKSNVATVTSAKNDNLTIYFEPEHITINSTSCDDLGSAGKPFAEQRTDAKKIVNALWTRLQKIYGVKGSAITLPSEGNPGGDSAKPQPPLLRARSALGVLKYAAEQDKAPAIAILPPEDIREVIEQNKNRECPADDFYAVDPGKFPLTGYEEPEESHSKEKDAAKNAAVARIDDGRRSLLIMYPEKSMLSDADLEAEAYLGAIRKFMLIARSDKSPKNAFVSVNLNGEWYYIFNDDVISKRTLALITEFDTIQAVPPPSAPLTPSISVGGL